MNYRLNTGYNDWNNIHEKQTLYIGNKYHGAATKEAWEIIDTLKDRQKACPKIVKALTRIIHLIAYWGKMKKLIITTFSEILEIFGTVQKIAKYYPLLHEHIFPPLTKDLSYMSQLVKMD